MEKVEGMMDTIVLAFEKQLDGLFGDQAMDISTDITVLENMMAREGLTDQELKAQTGPETDGTLRGGQLQPVIDYAAAHHYRFCPEQGAFLYCLNGGEEALQLVFCFQVRVEPENG